MDWVSMLIGAFGGAAVSALVCSLCVGAGMGDAYQQGFAEGKCKGFGEGYELAESEGEKLE